MRFSEADDDPMDLHETSLRTTVHNAGHVTDVPSEHLFNLADKDKSGQIDKQEFDRLYSVMKEDMKQVATLSSLHTDESTMLTCSAPLLSWPLLSCPSSWCSPVRDRSLDAPPLRKLPWRRPSCARTRPPHGARESSSS